MKRVLFGISFIACTGLASIALAQDMNEPQQQTKSTSNDGLLTPDQANNLKTPDQANNLVTTDQADAYRAAHPEQLDPKKDLTKGAPLEPAWSLQAPPKPKPAPDVPAVQPATPVQPNQIPPA